MHIGIRFDIMTNFLLCHVCVIRLDSKTHSLIHGQLVCLVIIIT